MIFAVSAVIAIAAWIAFDVYTGITLEDALITFRYAQNLAEGNGFVFNLNEHVLGTTTPLFTLLLGFLGSLFGSELIPRIADVLMIAASWAAGLFTYLGLRAHRISASFAAFASSVFFLCPNTMWTTTGGMETSLVICWMALSFWAISTDRFSLAAISASLLTLTRIDGAIWAVGIFGLIFFTNKRALAKSVIIGAAIMLPWFIFAFSYFGSVVPNTIGAKQVIGNTIEFSLSGVITEARWYANAFSSSSPFLKILGLFLFLSGALAIFRKFNSAPLKWLVIFPFTLTGALYAGSAPHFPWYYVPAAWSSLVVGMLGLHELWPRIEKKLGVRTWFVAPVLAVLYLALMVWPVSTTAEYQKQHQINENGLRMVVGEWLKDNTHAEASVAMEAIGYQGYYSRRRVIDLAGLVSPEVVAIRRNTSSNAESFEKICNTLKPDYIVLRSFEYPENKHYHGGPLFLDDAQKQRFDHAFAPVKELIAPLQDFWGIQAKVTIYRSVS